MVLFLPFWSVCVLFLIRLARINTMLNRSNDSRHPSFAPNLRRNAFSPSPFSMMFTVGFVVDGLYLGENISFYF